MPSPRDLFPIPMRRVALVAPALRFRSAAVAIAARGTFEPDPAHDVPPGPAVTVAERTHADADHTAACLSIEPVDPEALVSTGAIDLLLGEASLETRTAAARTVGRCRVLPGWMRGDDLEPGRTALATSGAALVDLPGRRGLTPPTAHAASRAGDAFRPLVSTYATVPYQDVDPTIFAAAAYVAMFGMMFGDVAHGLAIVAAGAAIVLLRSSASPASAGPGRSSWPQAWRRRCSDSSTARRSARPAWCRRCGSARSTNPTRCSSPGWPSALRCWPSRSPCRSSTGGGKAAPRTRCTRHRGSPARCCCSARQGWRRARSPTPSGRRSPVGSCSSPAPCSRSPACSPPPVARAAGIAQAVIELFDTLLRLGSNLVSFTRLAAFGLTHAVISEVVWDGTTSLWGSGSLPTRLAALVLFVAGNAAAFALGALVAAIQALRLEYYELFSRLFVTSGRSFDPWYVPTATERVLTSSKEET